jgi:DNA-binding CsgD family transcriptional regulator
MSTVHSIVNKSARVLSYISQNIQPDQTIDHESLIKVLQSMCRLNPQSVLITCPASHNNFFYISENCTSLFGYNADEMQRTLRHLPSYISQIHDADIDDLHDCINFVQQFIQTECISDPQNLRCYLYYRFLHANGSYIYLQDQKATFAATNQTIYYSLLREMDAGAPFQGVKIEIYREGPHFEKLITYKPSEKNYKLSSRENDLVNLIRRGLTTKEIASYLNLSQNTVRNIKSNMFRKFKVNNSIELLNAAG